MQGPIKARGKENMGGYVIGRFQQVKKERGGVLQGRARRKMVWC